MARGENPGQQISVDTTLTYAATEDFGHASAGGNLALSAITTGGNAGKYQLAADGARIGGTLLDLDKDQVANMMFEGKPMILRKTAAAIVVGAKVVGGGSGKVKSGTGENARGYVHKVLETADNGRILVFMPA